MVLVFRLSHTVSVDQQRIMDKTGELIFTLIRKIVLCIDGSSL